MIIKQTDIQKKIIHNVLSNRLCYKLFDTALSRTRHFKIMINNVVVDRFVYYSKENAFERMHIMNFLYKDENPKLKIDIIEIDPNGLYLLHT